MPLEVIVGRSACGVSGVADEADDVARADGTPAHLVDDVRGIDESWLDGCESVGLTSGASAPERLVAEVCAWFAARGAEVCEQAPVHEDVSFKLPVELRRAERAVA